MRGIRRLIHGRRGQHGRLVLDDVQRSAAAALPSLPQTGLPPQHASLAADRGLRVLERSVRTHIEPRQRGRGTPNQSVRRHAVLRARDAKGRMRAALRPRRPMHHVPEERDAFPQLVPADDLHGQERHLPPYPAEQLMRPRTHRVAQHRVAPIVRPVRLRDTARNIERDEPRVRPHPVLMGMGHQRPHPRQRVGAQIQLPDHGKRREKFRHGVRQPDLQARLREQTRA